MAETLPCRACDYPVPPTSPTHRRLQLCAIHACRGILAVCKVCGENWPEHGPGGRGCATWVYPPEWVQGTPLVAGGN